MLDTQTYNEKELLLRIVEKDGKAFTIVYERYYAQIYYFAKRIVGNEAAKDITIEVFAKLWENRTIFENGTHLSAYLRKLARNSCIDLIRRSKVQKKHEEILLLSDQQYEEVYFKDILEARVYSLIAQHIEKLPDHQKTIFKLAFYEGLKNDEIAKRLSIKDSTVRVGKAEAIKKLRLALKYTDILTVIAITFPAKNIFRLFT